MYSKQQFQERSYTLPDQIFLIKTRLNDMALNGKRYSKKKLLESILHLDWIVQEL